MNQTYYECYEFDVNIVRILIVACIYKSTLYWVSMNESDYIVKLKYCCITNIQNFMSAFE